MSIESWWKGFVKIRQLFLSPGLTSADDGFTGTNFDRPDFRRMIADLETGRIDCVAVKDLSRFGRDYIDVGYYLERYFPSRNVRFIAVNDGVDSGGAYDLLLPIRNVFNAQYAKDVSEKVKSAFKAKQRRGEFCGAFACFGYRKDPKNNDHLIVDPVAAGVVRHIFALAAEGVGQQAIADLLNRQKVPCPIEYKRLMGEKYHIGGSQKGYLWTYASVHKILRNETYIGNMIANKNARQRMHGKAKANDKSAWIVIEGTHEPIVSKALWETVQRQTNRNARASDAQGRGGLFTGFLYCGACGSTMVKVVRNRKTAYSCGSYHRRGATVCTDHFILEETLCGIVLRDLERLMERAGDLKPLAEQMRTEPDENERIAGQEQLRTAIERIRALRQGVDEDARDKLLSPEECGRYRSDYARQEETLLRQLAQAEERSRAETPRSCPWVENLLEHGGLSGLDRATVAQTVEAIRVFSNRHVEVAYRFSADALRGQ